MIDISSIPPHSMSAEHDFRQFTNTQFDKDNKQKSTLKRILSVDLVLIGLDGDTLAVYRTSRDEAHEAADRSLLSIFKAKLAQRSSSIRGIDRQGSNSSSSSSNNSRISSESVGGNASRVPVLKNKGSARGGDSVSLDSGSQSTNMQRAKHALASNDHNGHRPSFPEPHQFSGVRIEVEGEGFLYKQVRCQQTCICIWMCSCFKKYGGI